LSEIARINGLFDWVATRAVRASKGSPTRLFWLVYAAGTFVTIFLSNDATAVVLTPAVCAVAAAAEVPAIPYVLACAFTANAASFVLPVSNPANLVLYASHPPPLREWLDSYFAASVASIVLTGACLYWSQRKVLRSSSVTIRDGQSPLASGGRLAAVGILIASVALLLASDRGHSLGWAALLVALGTQTAVCKLSRRPFLEPFHGVSWSVVPLVAALFILTQAAENGGLLGPVEMLFAEGGTVASAGGLAVLCNIGNNLPVGMLMSSVLQQGVGGDAVRLSVIVVDLSPNLSVTGSLATLLWLRVLRREGVDISWLGFLKVGLFAMPVALVGALAVSFL
ncbi:MAG: anion permease, partial [Candidatus Eremiobacteraeota bacterium]|nr:anion permease [Candidatus Eremiobacteraeota bacterium]